MELPIWQTNQMNRDALPLDDVLEAVGPRLRSVRLERGATLAELSQATGISVSTLSRLESGQRRPTLELLLQLARAHQVPLDKLVDAPAPSDPRIRHRPVKRNGVIYIPLTRRPGGVQAYKLVFPSNPSESTPKLQVHEGYEWLYVLSGRLRLLLGQQDLILEAGEVVEFDTHIPHAFVNSGSEPAEVLSLFGSQGERLHLRTGPK
jgi:transcriptional regulator with XRE-family HTH domain